MIRFLDILFGLIGLIILFPFFIIISIIIVIDSKGSVFYRQTRVGRNGKDFKLLKFRTMLTDSDRKGLLTVGNNDSRITSSGSFLRRFKLDELPQLINVLAGDMSLVGPRPEVRKYVDLYNESQMGILSIRPGITDLASIYYRNENEILADYNDPERAYVEIIMPHKIELNMKYINDYSLKNYFLIIFSTIINIFR
jgi:lipopolysaccharide/colanic/teichoic acid biosynthesis glycosyltransferase